MHGVREQVVTAVTAVAVLAVFGWLVAWPQQVELARIRGEIEQVSLDIAVREQQGNAAIATQVELRESRRRLAPLRDRIPQSEQLGAFIARLSELSAKAGMQATNVVPRAPYVVAGLGTLPIEMTFEGTFDSLYSFLREIESMQRLVRVSAIDTRREKQASPLLTTELTLQVFFEAT